MTPATERSRAQLLSADVAVGMFAGLVATWVTDLAQGPLQRLTPDSVARQERRVRPPGGDTSAQVAAARLADHLDRSPDQRQVALLGKAIHLGIGMAWGPVYGLLRRHGGLGPSGAGLVSGAAMALVLDEGVVPVLGLSAANRDYPALTHLRGFVAHLVYGAAVALAAEGLGRLVGRPPGRRPLTQDRVTGAAAERRSGVWTLASEQAHRPSRRYRCTLAAPTSILDGRGDQAGNPLRQGARR